GDALKQQGSFDLTDSLTKLSPALSTQRYPIADGTAFIRPVALRNLAPDQTLVLVNGTRRHRSALVNLQLSPIGTINQGTQAVDFSAIPSSAVKRVEILRDGASAQYGSDAIAGVVNVILNDANEGYSISAQYGEYSEGDGERLIVSANAGFALGSQGFLNVSLETSQYDITTRGNPREDAQAVAAEVGADKVEYNGFGQRWGDPDTDDIKLFFNTAYEINDSVELFSNLSYMEKEVLSGFFYRTPVGVDGIGPRSTLRTVDGGTENNALFADQALVDEIVADGLNVDDYLVANGASPSGYELTNAIADQFPGGYSPKFGADITDYSFIFGGRGNINSNLTYDARMRMAENEVEYTLKGSINPSLGRLSPT
ncbi:hypothetical protein LCGC14_2973250, partial [marine sediment metagenome]